MMFSDAFDLFWDAWMENRITDEEYNVVSKILSRLEYGDEE